MFIKYLYIKQYKKFEDFKVSFLGNSDFRKHYKDFYKNMNFTVLVGENGVGKTTIMSFITQIFHNLERYHSRIPSDFDLHYDIFDENKKLYQEIRLRKVERNIFIKIPKYEEECLLLEWTHTGKGIGYDKRKNYQLKIENKDVRFEEIIEYLPSEVITSVFSIHGEYPINRNSNYYGDYLIKNYDINMIYGKNHFGGPSISKGISSFIQLYIKQKELVKGLLANLNLELVDKVKVHDNGYVQNDFTEAEEWLDFSALNSIAQNRLFDLESSNFIYFNDLKFLKNGAEITLENMSSGEKMFLYRIFSIMSSIEKNSVVIIEEPELHLNPSWTKQIITMFYLLFKNYNSHFIIATHSYSFINTLFPDNILMFKNNEVKTPSFNTFLADEKEIIYNIFENSDKNNYPESKLLEKIKSANKQELQEIMSYLGESFYRFLVFNELENSED
ncbi:hypothetical protein COM77_23310 [Bacillus cereus]|uniref:ATP-binding protein n=1 Tax=Bacillus cereus TaxID=1396 RepID=UPI000BEB893F|nr:ATP-binding protein [Bacillus cereus]MDA1935453.1 AAA family ATPase [Bacillus cereus]MDA1941358.1 AAA family ATPase [Bacillus cereus]PEB33852.1 hypothetical protein COM77_23310 [Bacillus cereus]TKH24125.1 hypothetical protein FC692_21935 [Bacillus cereus]